MYFICSSVSSSSFFFTSSLTLPFLLYCGRFAAPFALPLLPILNAGQQRRRMHPQQQQHGLQVSLNIFPFLP